MYVKATDSQVIAYPYRLPDLRRDNPNVSFPREISIELLAEYNIYPVVEAQRPDPTLTQDPAELEPQLINGQWTQVWTLVDVSPEEAAVRQQDAADVAASTAVKADAFVQRFIAMTPAQVTNYVDANTANIAQVRALMNKMALILLALAKREYRE
jgi:hypothetical protein